MKDDPSLAHFMVREDKKEKATRHVSSLESDQRYYQPKGLKAAAAPSEGESAASLKPAARALDLPTSPQVNISNHLLGLRQGDLQQASPVESVLQRRGYAQQPPEMKPPGRTSHEEKDQAGGGSSSSSDSDGREAPHR